MFTWFRRSKPVPEVAPVQKPHGRWLTDLSGPVGFGVQMMETAVRAARACLPRAPAGTAMDDSSGAASLKLSTGSVMLPDALLGWFASQTFIGYQLCAMIAQQWLVDKACTMPARDAIRHGFAIQLNDVGTEELASKISEDMRKRDKQFRLYWNLEQFIRMGRVFGVRVAFFRVRSADPLYYEKPYNPDGITPGSYEGISQVDPYWCTPVLEGHAAANPADPNFYEPTFWVINGRRYHRSHLCIFRNSEVPDLLKPMYQYGGVSVPQKIMERVYAAERTANEGPQLAMTKRTMVWNTDVGAMLANQDKFAEHMQNWMGFRDNYGVKINDTDDKMEQFDTTLSDLDATIMTQYQLVAAIANVPANKLLGTTPKGFNSTGEYEEASYHEELESIQANDLTAFLERHYEIMLRSDFETQNGMAPGTVQLKIDWAPLDSPTAKEYAEINKIKAETDQIYSTIGAIDGEDVRARLRKDDNSDYTDLEDDMVDPTDPLDVVTAAMNGEDPNATDPGAVEPQAPGVGEQAPKPRVPGNPAKPPGRF